MATVVSNSPSPNDILKAIEGTRHWSGTITINFLDETNQAEVDKFRANMLIEGLPTDLHGLPPGWRTEIVATFDVWSQYANISYSESDSIDANYLVGDNSTTGTYGAWYPPDDNAPTANAELPIASFAIGAAFMQAAPEVGGGGFRQWTMIHEVGHALGLDHPQDDANGSVDINPGSDAAFPLPPPYCTPYTVMSYDMQTVDGLSFGTIFGLPVTPMALDIAAVQEMYGATTRMRKKHSILCQILNHKTWISTRAMVP